MAEKTIPATAPVIQVSARNWHDVLQAAWMFPVLKVMRETTILAVTDSDIAESAEQARQTFGTRIVRISAATLKAQYERISQGEAYTWAEGWRKGARQTGNVPAQLLVDNARMYLAISRMMWRAGAKTVAVDCQSIRQQNAGLPLPCMSHFQINNDGGTAVCTADIDVACAQTLMQAISRRPGIVASPKAADTPRGMLLSHSACTNRLFGPAGEQSRYTLRESELDHGTVNVQTTLPKSEPLTLVGLDLASRELRIASAESAGSTDSRDRCRTCIFAKKADDPIGSGSLLNAPCVMQFGAYSKRAAYAAKLARVRPSGAGALTG